MKNRKLIFIGLFIFLSVVIGSFIYFPKSIDTALNRIKYPFEVGEILTSQQIDENLIVVIYTNKNNNNELQNAIIQKNSIFYSVVEMNGSLNIEIPQKPQYRCEQNKLSNQNRPIASHKTPDY